MEHDPIIQAAKRDLEALDAQRQDIIDFLERYRLYKGAALRLSVEPTESMALNAQTRGARADEVLSAVADILIGHNDAMSLSDIFDKLRERGIVVGGKNPKQNLSQKLSADEQLKSYGKHGWYFADKLPPCMGGKSCLAENRSDQYEEDLALGMARPLQSNGAAGSYPA
jgi:hypothetical protein